jgi:hypothetical protein
MKPATQISSSVSYMTVSKIKYKLLLIIIAAISTSLLTTCKNDVQQPVPAISVSKTPYTIVEDAPFPYVSLRVSLSDPSANEVTIDFKTADSTASAGKDYVAVTAGKLVFKAGETSKEISINILQDTAQKEDVYFTVVLSNPVNAVLNYGRAKVKIINVDYGNLVWSDEFSTGQLNTTFWNYELGASGWGNNELQNYTSSDANVHIDSGYLHITALNPSGTSYTSGRITTKAKKEFTYGRFEIRARLPEGKGIWPALWMLGGNISSVGWPKCGEIDIMELLGDTPSKVYGSLHWDSNGHLSRSSQFSLPGGKFSSGFHKFTLVWTPNTLSWYIDNQRFLNIFRSEISAFPFDLPAFLIFNVAVGGNWPGSPDATTLFPQHMIVDYVRVYK